MRGVDKVVTEWLSHVLIMKYICRIYICTQNIAVIVLPDIFSHALDQQLNFLDCVKNWKQIQ